MTLPAAEQALDNPVWSCLTTRHAHLALGDGLARRYVRDVSPIAGLPSSGPENVSALERLVDAGDDMGIVGPFMPKLTDRWQTLHASALVQMIRRESSALPEGAHDVSALGPDDVGEILALIELTQPGPFRRRTIELGTYIGIRQRGRLVAMAGERMHVGTFHEVSAICTHPDWRGRGYARALIGRVVNRMLRANETPFLHTEEGNTQAIDVYRSLGFVQRARFGLLVAKRVA